MTHTIALIHKEPGSGYGVSFPDVPGRNWLPMRWSRRCRTRYPWVTQYAKVYSPSPIYIDEFSVNFTEYSLR